MKNFTLFYKLLLLLFGAGGLVLFPKQLLAQSYQLPSYGAANYTTCSGTLYDDGGPTGNYSGNSEGVVTLTPATPGSKIQLTFTVVDIDYPRAVISVYDGPSTASLLIDSFGAGTYTVHATNTKGELTVRLYSGSSAQPKPGFAATISCETNVLLPDLVVGHATVAPTRVMPTQRFTTQVQLSNPSTLPTLNYVSFYFSTDSVYSPNDIYIGSSVGERLAPGQSTPYGAYFRVPEGTAPGRYYALCIADQYRAISESNENNNLAYASVEVLPAAADLQPERFGTPTSIGSVVPGEGRIVDCSIVNQGVLAAPATTVGYYLSRDNVLSPDDDFIDKAPLSALAAGASAFTSVGVSIPPTTPYGRYYVFFVADYLHELAENDETNNVAYVTLDVVPPTVDLTFMYTPLMLKQAGAGSTLSTICYVANHGNVTANPCTVGYYLSTDATLSPDDILIGDTIALGTTTLGILVAGDYSHADGYFTIPPTTAVGNYYVLVVADYLNQLTESDETNNVSAVAFEVVIPNIDLQIDSPSVNPSPVAYSNPLSVNCFLSNQGTTPVSPATVGYYLSTDKNLSADDQLIGTSSISALGGRGYGFAGSFATIPASTPVGSYYVLMLADYLHRVVETDETNNMAYVAVEVVKPSYDLSFRYPPTIGPTPAPAGSTLTTTFELQNLGPTPTYGMAVGYYLSTDNILSANDVLIGSTPPYTISSSFYTTSTAVLPLTTPPGNYYVLFVADYLQKLAETNEDNNLAYAAIQVTAAYADLAIPAAPIASPTQALAGTKISAICTLQNLGNGLASPATIGYYLSADQVLDAQDVLIGQATTSPVYPGTGAYVPGTAAIPATTASGAYYVLFVADPFSQLAESNETNNGNYAALRVLVAGVDLTVQAPTATPTAVVAGGTLAVSATLFNGGNAEAASNPMGFYLSTNPTFDATDVLLSTSPGGTLASAAGSVRRATLTVPTSTATGNYYLLLVADPLNIVPEANERNNLAFLPLTITGTFSGTVVPASGSNTITTCTGKVYDNGGPGDYPDNANGTLTIMPGTAGGLVELTFSTFATEKTADYLEVYDGLTTSARLLGTFTGTGLPGTVRADNSSTTGALTLHFVSNSSTNAAGFEATISCAQKLATREQTAGYQLSVAPNPADSATPLQVQFSGPGTRRDATLTLYNSLGQGVSSQAMPLVPDRINQAVVPTAGLATGVYMLRVTGPDLNVTRRVVIE